MTTKSLLLWVLLPTLWLSPSGQKATSPALSQSGVSLFYFFGNVAVNPKGQYCQWHGKEKQRVKQRNGKMLVKKAGNNRAKRHADIYADVKGTISTLR